MAASRTDSVTILANASNSSVLSNPGWALAAEIHAPSTLAETTTVWTGANAAAVTNALQSSGINVTIAAGTSSIVYPCPMFLLIHLGSNAAANRTFNVVWRTV